MKNAAWAVIHVVAVGLLLFGFGCLNYTKARGWEHHTQFAIEHGLPRPSERILFGGALALITGSGLLGYGFGRRAAAARM